MPRPPDPLATHSPTPPPQARRGVDVATLTGACVIALGAHTSAVMSNDEDLARNSRRGPPGEDRAWHMPMAEEYHDQLKSNFADFANACGREGGAITAACFLAKFTDGLRWAHLDIAVPPTCPAATRAARAARCRCWWISDPPPAVTATQVDFYC